ncbi:MAG: Gfo/Idh/MocA family oxidoreductase [Armatimonadetes bacterium]|nr:Gfo/Idh/MocA family oxidoreductase [Armatimonadota bacterium]
MSGVTPMGWGIVGAGGVARRRMLPAMRGLPEVYPAALMVRDRARAEALAEEFGAAAAYDSVAELVADPAVEAVYVASPPDVHPEHVALAAAAGKPVLVEKPMALSSAAGEAMAAAAAAAGVRLAVCFPLRHTPAAQHLRGWLSDGDLGPLTYLRAQLAKWYPLHEQDWRAQPGRSGGGAVMDLGSHLLDLAAYLGGRVTGVRAVTARRVWATPVEDTAVVGVVFESGALGTLEVSFAAQPGGQAVEVYGTQGSAWVEDVRNGQTLRRSVAGGTEEVPLPSVDVYAAELLDFTVALREERPAATTEADGLANLACLEAVYRAAATGEAVSVP